MKMTNEEAIIDIRENIQPIVGGKSLDIAISALEKQIPKKPTYEEICNVYGARKRTCAKCGDVCLISEGAKPFEHYCRYCGQALDLSDTE